MRTARGGSFSGACACAGGLNSRVLGSSTAVVCGSWSTGRAALLTDTPTPKTTRHRNRPYLYTAYAAGGAGLVYSIAKAFYFQYGAAWLSEAGVIALFGCYSWIHVLAARNVVAWAKKRAALGLATFPWEPGLRESLLLPGG